MTQTPTTETDSQVMAAQVADDAGFLDLLAATKGYAEDAAKRYGKMEQMAMDRAKATGATVLYGNNGLTFEITTKTEYDKTKAGPVLEFFTPEEKAKCHTPAHWGEPEWILEKHDMTQIKAAAKKHGNEAMAALAEMTFPGARSGKLVRSPQ